MTFEWYSNPLPAVVHPSSCYLDGLLFVVNVLPKNFKKLLISVR